MVTQRQVRQFVCAGVLALGVAGCGGKGDGFDADSDAPATQTSTAAAKPAAVAPEQEVREVIASFGAATLHRDWRTICRDLLAPSLVRNVEQYGRRCEDVWQQNLEGVVAPRLSVRSVSVAGRKAEAQVESKAIGEDPADVRLTLVRDASGWQIASQS